MTEPCPDVDIVVYDSLPKISAPLIRALAQRFVVSSRGLDEPAPPVPDRAPLPIFFTSLASLEAFRRVKSRVERLEGGKIFILPTHNSVNAKRLHELGADCQALVMPVEPAELCAAAKAGLNRRVEASWASLEPPQRKSLEAGLACFTECFARIRSGQPPPIHRIEDSCRLICESTRSGSLTDWLSALRDHHDHTMRHSMLVCGSLTYFASGIGVGARDLHTLSIGGMMHDIGKMRTPLEILDKPGELDDQEWEIMRRHPEQARDILLCEEERLGHEAVAMALQHHERLDGTGYPNGLRGAEINDHVRLIMICDVFVALIEKRAYKGRMTSEAALDLMAEMAGKLDPDLLRVFREFVLDREPSLRSGRSAPDACGPIPPQALGAGAA